MSNTSLSMLLYLVSAVLRLLLANAIGQIAVLSGAMFSGNCKLSLTYNRPDPNPKLNASVSEYRYSFSLESVIHASSSMMVFTSSDYF